MRYTNIFDALCTGTVGDVQYFTDEKGVDANVKDSGGRTPLHEAAKCGNTEVVKF